MLKFGFITKFPVSFYFDVVAGAKQWASSHKNVSVTYLSGKSGTDDPGEIAAVQDLLAKGVQGIFITPTSTALIPILTKAVHQGVKVVLGDNNLPTWSGKSSFVGTNNYKGATLAGGWLKAHLKSGSTLGVLEGVPGNPSLDDRVTGVLAALGVPHPTYTWSGTTPGGIKVLAAKETDCDQTKGEQAAQNILTANPNINAIYSACGPPALGAIQAIAHAKLTGKVILVGFDGLPAEVVAIKAGQESATVAQHPNNIGLDGLETLYAAVMGQKVPAVVDTGTSLITKQSLK
jgi:ABC-type sugar transport system substrate-binding protein